MYFLFLFINNKMKSFRDFIKEGIYKDNRENIIFDYNNDNKFDLIKTSFGKNKNNPLYKKK